MPRSTARLVTLSWAMLTITASPVDRWQLAWNLTLSLTGTSTRSAVGMNKSLNRRDMLKVVGQSTGALTASGIVLGHATSVELSEASPPNQAVANQAVANQASPQGKDYGQPRRLIAAPENPRFAHLAWPKVCRTKDGTLVVAYVAARAHTRGGCPAVSISADGGRSFTRPHVLTEFDSSQNYAHCGNVALGTSDDGTVVLLAMAFTGDKCNTIVGWRSVDSGKSWQPIDATNLAENTTGSVFGEVFNVPGKGLAVFGHYRKPSDPMTGIWMAYSTDDGRSWGVPQLVTKSRYYEPAFTFTEERFIGLLRHPPGPETRRYDQAVSDDLGKTWQIGPSTIALAPEVKASLPSPFITVSSRDPTTLYALQSERGSSGKSRGRIYLWIADAKKLVWLRKGLVVSIPETAKLLGDWSYPSDDILG